MKCLARISREAFLFAGLFVLYPQPPPDLSRLS